MNATTAENTQNSPLMPIHSRMCGALFTIENVATNWTNSSMALPKLRASDGNSGTASLWTYMKIGYDHRDRAGERYVPATESTHQASR